jgi:hypothetical protein
MLSLLQGAGRSGRAKGTISAMHCLLFGEQFAHRSIGSPCVVPDDELGGFSDLPVDLVSEARVVLTMPGVSVYAGYNGCRRSYLMRCVVQSGHHMDTCLELRQRIDDGRPVGICDFCTCEAMRRRVRAERKAKASFLRQQWKSTHYCSGDDSVPTDDNVTRATIVSSMSINVGSTSSRNHSNVGRTERERLAKVALARQKTIEWQLSHVNDNSNGVVNRSGGCSDPNGADMLGYDRVVSANSDFHKNVVVEAAERKACIDAWYDKIGSSLQCWYCGDFDCDGCGTLCPRGRVSGGYGGLYCQFCDVHISQHDRGSFNRWEANPMKASERLCCPDPSVLSSVCGPARGSRNCAYCFMRSEERKSNLEMDIGKPHQDCGQRLRWTRETLPTLVWRTKQSMSLPDDVKDRIKGVLTRGMSRSGFGVAASPIVGGDYAKLPFFVQATVDRGKRTDRGRGFHLWLHRYLDLKIPVGVYLSALWTVIGLTEEVLVVSRAMWNVDGPVHLHISRGTLATRRQIGVLVMALVNRHISS